MDHTLNKTISVNEAEKGEMIGPAIGWSLMPKSERDSAELTLVYKPTQELLNKMLIDRLELKDEPEVNVVKGSIDVKRTTHQPGESSVKVAFEFEKLVGLAVFDVSTRIQFRLRGEGLIDGRVTRRVKLEVSLEFPQTPNLPTLTERNAVVLPVNKKEADILVLLSPFGGRAIEKQDVRVDVKPADVKDNHTVTATVTKFLEDGTGFVFTAAGLKSQRNYVVDVQADGGDHKKFALSTKSGGFYDKPENWRL